MGTADKSNNASRTKMLAGVACAQVLTITIARSYTVIARRDDGLCKITLVQCYVFSGKK
jgi:hypothetical protein